MIRDDPAGPIIISTYQLLKTIDYRLRLSTTNQWLNYMVIKSNIINCQIVNHSDYQLSTYQLSKPIHSKLINHPSTIRQSDQTIRLYLSIFNQLNHGPWIQSINNNNNNTQCRWPPCWQAVTASSQRVLHSGALLRCSVPPGGGGSCNERQQ